MQSKLKILIIIVAQLFLVIDNIYCQSNELLIGSWKGIKKELRDGNTGENFTLNGKPYQANEYFKLLAEGIGIDLISNTKFKYSFKDNILVLGKQLYKVETLTNEKLIIIEYKPEKPESNWDFRIYFKKINKSK